MINDASQGKHYKLETVRWTIPFKLKFFICTRTTKQGGRAREDEFKAKSCLQYWTDNKIGSISNTRKKLFSVSFFQDCLNFLDVKLNGASSVQDVNLQVWLFLLWNILNMSHFHASCLKLCYFTKKHLWRTKAWEGRHTQPLLNITKYLVVNKFSWTNKRGMLWWFMSE